MFCCCFVFMHGMFLFSVKIHCDVKVITRNLSKLFVPWFFFRFMFPTNSDVISSWAIYLDFKLFLQFCLIIIYKFFIFFNLPFIDLILPSGKSWLTFKLYSNPLVFAIRCHTLSELDCISADSFSSFSFVILLFDSVISVMDFLWTLNNSHIFLQRSPKFSLSSS